MLINRSISFIENKNGNNFLICYYIFEKDLPNYLERQRIGIQELMKKIADSSYKIGSSQAGLKLFDRDKSLFEKLYSGYVAASNKNKYISTANLIQTIRENRIIFLMDKIIDQKVIPISDIDFGLKSSLFTYLQNNSDSNILASGIQQHNRQHLYLVTADRKDWNVDNLEWAMTAELRKKYPSIPKIIYP